MSYLIPWFYRKEMKRGETVLGHPYPLLHTEGLIEISWGRMALPLALTIKRELQRKTKT